MKKLYLCTTNHAKKARYRRFFEYVDGIQLIIPDSLPDTAPESADTEIGNAIQKAKHYREVLNADVLCIDEGLYFDHLGTDENPGVHVRRRNGKYLNDEELHNYVVGIAEEADFTVTGRYQYGYAIATMDSQVLTAQDSLGFYIDLAQKGAVYEGYPTSSIIVDFLLKKARSDMSEEELLAIDQRELISFREMLNRYDGNV